MLKRLFASRKHPFVPGINKPEHIEFDLSGNKLSLTLPPHSDYEGFEADQAPITKVNIYDPSIYREPENIFSSILFVKRTWEFYGPIWKTQPVGTTRFIAVIEKPNCPPEGMSCFNPNHFEQVINRFIYKLGPEAAHISESRKAPVNWQVKMDQGIPWVLFEQQKDLKKIHAPSPFSAAQYSSYCFAPLDDHLYLRLSFGNLGYAPVEDSIKHMNAIRNKVLANAKISLNMTAKNQLETSLKRWPSATISKQRLPENWQYPEWRDGDTSIGEPALVILKPGTPAPKFTP